MVRLPNYTCPIYGSIRFPNKGEIEFISDFREGLSKDGTSQIWYLLENTNSLIFVL